MSESRKQNELYSKQKIEALQAANRKLKKDLMKKEDELQETRDKLIEERRQTVSQLQRAFDQRMVETSAQLQAKERKINELVVMLQAQCFKVIFGSI
uniref:Uncharacterized protein n=1 Tax=Amphimedon queenslandica TaxID=400682 RepID=A0A1X7SDR6_AMPQE